MKDLKNKEIIIELVILIILSIIAIFLIVRREIKNSDEPKKVVVQENDMQKDIVLEAEVETTDVASDTTSVSVAKTAAAKRATDQVAYYTAGKKMDSGEEEWQMAEIFSYWDAYKLDAVADLIRLDRVAVLTDSLAGSNDFYYYGEQSGNGVPNGKGLAIYANDAYYFGEWKDGKRSGNGMWLQIFPDVAVNMNGSRGVIEHSYNGQWADDFPNGQGQEHIEYNKEMLQETENIANVIGEFRDGYYDGEMYIMTITKTNPQIDWMADAEYGVFKPLQNTKNVLGKDPVWRKIGDVKEGEELYNWMMPEDNSGFGIYGLMK